VSGRGDFKAAIKAAAKEFGMDYETQRQKEREAAEQLGMRAAK
jgi:hypothetical protein